MRLLHWVKRWFFPSLVAVLAVTLLVEHQYNQVLRERVELLERLSGLQHRWCEGVERVNRVCEVQLVGILQRLGLDNEMMPLVTTALWKRASGNFRVSEARRLWGAKPAADGYLQVDDVVPPSPDPMDNPPIGGTADQ